MAKAKKISVEDILRLMDGEETVIVHIYAYGIHAGTSWKDHIETAEECLKRLKHECLKAKVYRVTRNWVRAAVEDKTDQWIEIHAEVTQ